MCRRRRFSHIQPGLSDNFPNKTVRDGMLGLGMAPKEILSRLFNSFNLKILDLYLETWLWTPLICAEKSFHGGVDIWDYMKTYTFNNFVYFLTFSGIFTIILIFLFLLVYISFLRLLSLPKLILSSILSSLFIIIIYQFS